MKKLLGIFGLLLFLCLFTGLMEPNFFTAYNLENDLKRIGPFGIIGIGALFVIITGGIDLSIGSVVGLIGVLLPWMLRESMTEERQDLVCNAYYWLAAVVAVALHVTLVKRAFGVSRREGLLSIFVPGYSLYFGIRGQLALVISLVVLPSALVVLGLLGDKFGGFGGVDQEQNGFGICLICFWVVSVSIVIGLTHGLLITKLKLQPFVVTLCGLMIYRSLARYIANEKTQGFGTGYKELMSTVVGRLPAKGGIPWGEDSMGDPAFLGLPIAFLIMIGIAIVAAIFLNKTIYGRYLMALGRNEQAARFSGIGTDRMVILAYVLCSLCAGLGAIIFALEVNSVQPSNQGAGYEMYAIAAAVLGGCSLRGGEGSITGVVIGAAVVQVLYNAIVLLGIPSTLEGTIIGLVILAGVITDELVKRISAAHRAAREARLATAGED